MKQIFEQNVKIIFGSLSNSESVNDEYVGLIKVDRSINRYCKWKFNGVSKENRNLFLEENTFSKHIKTILIILESPHIHEFDTQLGNHPALGKTGENISKYLPDLINSYVPTTIFENQSVYDSLNDVPSGSYQVVLVNAIQYQCSQGKEDRKKKEKLFRKLFKKNSEFYSDFTKRISAYSPNVIINASTSFIHNRVWKVIDKIFKLPVIKIDANHPSVWDIKNHSFKKK